MSAADSSVPIINTSSPFVTFDLVVPECRSGFLCDEVKCLFLYRGLYKCSIGWILRMDLVSQSFIEKVVQFSYLSVVT